MGNGPKVVFHDNDGFEPIPIPRPEPPTLSKRIMHLGIASSPGDTAIIIAIFATVLIALNIYLFAKAVPQPPPPLGNDMPRSGEMIPEYVR